MRVLRIVAVSLALLAGSFLCLPVSAQTSVWVFTRAQFGDGTASLPSMAFASEPTLGFYRSASGNIGTTAASLFFSNAAANINWTGRGFLYNTANGVFDLANQALTSGALLKVDALPTAGTCGTSPAVTAGSTPFAGSVNVGTGGTATACTVTFNGTAFPSAPFCTAGGTTATPANVRAVAASATTTVLTLTAASAWVASEVVSWVCVSSK